MKQILENIYQRKVTLFETGRYGHWTSNILNIDAIDSVIRPQWLRLDIPAERYKHIFAFLNVQF